MNKLAKSVLDYAKKSTHGKLHCKSCGKMHDKNHSHFKKFRTHKKLTMKQWEKSSMDKKIDKEHGYIEGTKRDNTADRKALAKYNRIHKKHKKSPVIFKKFDGANMNQGQADKFYRNWSPKGLSMVKKK